MVKKIILFIAVFTLLISFAYADTLVLQQGVNGYAGCKDTHINSKSPTSNYGTSVTFGVRGSQLTELYGLTYPVLKFELSSLPANAVIDSADLTLLLLSSTDTEPGREVQIRELTKDWQDNTATFLTRDGTNSWGTTATDTDTAAYFKSLSISSTQNIPPTRVAYTWSVTSLVQKTADSGTIPTKFFNIAIMRLDTSVRTLGFGSCDHSVIASRPKLTINYHVGCSGSETKTCSTGQYGVCAAGTQTCSGGTFGSCVRNVNPSTELCTGGLDEDCDNLVDCADSDCSANAACQVATCTDNDEDGYGIGTGCLGTDCDDSNPVRNPGSSNSFCNCVGTPTAEINCNNIDEDCSGQDDCQACTIGQQITTACSCGGTAYSSGYCCNNGHQTTQCPAVSYPTISAVSDNLMHDATITISGSNFGSKVVAEQLFWNNFNNGILNSAIPISKTPIKNTWTGYSVTGGNEEETTPKYSDQCINGLCSAYTLHCRVDPATGLCMAGDSSAGSSLSWTTTENTKKMFVSFWVYFDWGERKTHSIKLWRFDNVDTPELPKASLLIIKDQQHNGPVNTDGSIAPNSVDYEIQQGVDGLPIIRKYYNSEWTGEKVWYKVEAQLLQSDINVQDGSFEVWNSQSSGPMKKAVDFKNIMTRAVPQMLNRVSIGEYCVWQTWPRGSLCGGTNYFDDVYMDNSWARVVLGDAATYDACTKREQQLIKTWNFNQIAIQVNRGTFPDGKAYLYVVDENGNYNQNGYEVTVGGGCSIITCKSDAECNDGNAETVDTCKSPNSCASYCEHTIIPTKCSDGTLFDSCSATKPLFCQSDGNLANRCDSCGCPSGQFCNADNKECYIVDCDVDKDGYKSTRVECGGDDCDDSNPLINSGMIEICNDGKDNNCNSKIDSEDTTCSADDDNDGVANMNDLCANTPATIIDGSYNPTMTKFDIKTDLTGKNVRNTPLMVGLTNKGKITYESVDLAPVNPTGCLNKLDLDANINIDNNKIELNANNLPSLNKQATLEIDGLTFIKPRLLKDNQACPSSTCSIISYNEGNLIFSVTGFSTYSAVESPACGDGQVVSEGCICGAEFHTSGYCCGDIYQVDSCAGPSPPSGGGGGGGGGHTYTPAPQLNYTFTADDIVQFLDQGILTIHITPPDKVENGELYDLIVNVGNNGENGTFVISAGDESLSIELDNGATDTRTFELFAPVSGENFIITANITNGNVSAQDSKIVPLEYKPLILQAKESKEGWRNNIAINVTNYDQYSKVTLQVFKDGKKIDEKVFDGTVDYEWNKNIILGGNYEIKATAMKGFELVDEDIIDIKAETAMLSLFLIIVIPLMVIAALAIVGYLLINSKKRK